MPLFLDTGLGASPSPPHTDFARISVHHFVNPICLAATCAIIRLINASGRRVGARSHRGGGRFIWQARFIRQALPYSTFTSTCMTWHYTMACELKLQPPRAHRCHHCYPPGSSGPFKVLAVVGTQAYRLVLPAEYSRIHNLFHVSRLEPWKKRKGEEPPNQRMPLVVDTPAGDEYQVEAVLDSRLRRGIREYLVKWEGWSPAYNQWEPEAHLANAPLAVRAYWESQPARKRRGRPRTQLQRTITREHRDKE